MLSRLSAAAALAAACVVVLPESARAQNWVTVKGQVVFAANAQIPPQQPLKVEKDQNHCLAKGPLQDETWIVNPQNRGVRNAFVWIAVEKGQKLPIHPSLEKIQNPTVEIDQPQCAFVPRALGMRQGQTLVAKNSSPVAHNTNIQGHPVFNPGKNVIVPAGGKVEFQGFVAHPLSLSVACNIHPWMTAKVRVYDHPYFAVTDADGNFEIKLAPEGNFALGVWHEGSGWGPGGKNGTPIVIKGDHDAGKLEIKPN
jgi:hypothetical protein